MKRLIPDQHPLRLFQHKCRAFLAALLNGFPARKLTIVGITGTDGKTTTVGMVAHILNQNGFKAGALSTAFFQIGDRIEWNATQKTSPSPFTVQRFLKRLVAEGCTHALLEYSSHGLIQGRTLFTWPMVAGITNISEEHLDYHKTMDEYIRAKALLFSMVGRRGTGVLNHDDRSFEILRTIPMKLTVVYSPGSQLKDLRPMPESCAATAHIDGKDYSLMLPLPGAFNLHNALCAICCATALSGMTAEKAVQALATFRGIPGRMERIDEGQSYHVYIDFTVTPQSYRSTLSTVKASLAPGKRLLVLCGSCGDRMKEKRPIVGKIVSELADIMVVANEDPYTEDPEKIIDEVWAGIDQSTTQAHRIFDRLEAIKFLLQEAKDGDAILFCGKGSDTTMWVKSGQIPWNERELVRDLLKQMQSTSKGEKNYF